jgi:TRAP-type mannitol/chloroaromatic compound transport system permease small subunit
MGGDKPVGLIVGIVVTAVVVALPALIVPTFYVVANVYALITGSDFSSDTIRVPVFLIALVMTVAFFLLAMAGIVVLVGKGLTPRKRARA